MQRKSKPLVTVVTPTADRRSMIPHLLHVFDSQTYPAGKLELLIADDGRDKIDDLIQDHPRVRYLDFPEHVTLARKRQILNQEARGDIIVCMDDDDYYPPTRVAHAVRKILNSRKNIAGSTQLHIYDLKTGKIFLTPDYGSKHSYQGSMAYTKNYAQAHAFDESREFAEETEFTNGFSEDMIQLSPRHTTLCIYHGCNTFDKESIISRSQETKLSLSEFCKNDPITLNWVRDIPYL